MSTTRRSGDARLQLVPISARSRGWLALLTFGLPFALSFLLPLLGHGSTSARQWIGASLLGERWLASWSGPAMIALVLGTAWLVVDRLVHRHRMAIDAGGDRGHDDALPPTRPLGRSRPRRRARHRYRRASRIQANVETQRRFVARIPQRLVSIAQPHQAVRRGVRRLTAAAAPEPQGLHAAAAARRSGRTACAASPDSRARRPCRVLPPRVEVR